MARPWRTIPVVGIVTILLATLVMTGCSRLLFHPSRNVVKDETISRFKPVDIWIESGSETLHGWFFEARPARGTIVALHGNAENISTHVHGLLWLVTRGYSLLIVDYRGFGLSTGTPDLDGVHRDARAVIQFALTDPRLSTGRIALLGQSIGAAVAVHAIANTPRSGRLRCLILDSPFSSYQLIAREKLSDFILTWPLQYPLSWLFRDDYSPDRWIGEISVPTLFLHDEADRVVPLHHTRRLFDLARSPKRIIITNGHGHIGSFADPKTRDEVIAFLDGAM